MIEQEAARRLMRRTEAAEYLRIEPQTLAKWAVDGRGPAYHKVGRAVRYRVEDLDVWLAGQRVPMQ